MLAEVHKLMDIYMFNESHHFVEEFPEFKENIHQLKLSNRHFKKMLEDYEDVEKKIHGIEQEFRAVSDEYSEELKKKRVKLKDKLYAILQQSK
jgi:uncharacterized protein YdcH (DUF465 family)